MTRTPPVTGDSTVPATHDTPGNKSRPGAAVELINVVKDYSGHRALNGINLTIAPGEFIALLGPSGCGKTTALRALSGLETIDAGNIRIDDTDVASVPVNRRDIGMVFQSYSLFPHMTALENVEFGLRMRRVPAAERRSRALDALAMVGLAEKGHRFAHQLSGGQQQRVALARALVTRPRVLLLDEPLSALDATVRVQLREEIRRIQTDLGITTLFVTHDQEEALAVADRVAVMRDGQIEQIGSPEELYMTPATPFVADFVGVSTQVSATIVDGQVMVQGVALPLLGDPQPDGPVTAFIRPEDVRFITADATRPALSAHVVSSSFLGSQRRTQVRFEDGTLMSVQHEVGVHPGVGERVLLAFAGRPVSAKPRS
ncbi:MAG TPA: ABC transporter ATP-binding protein [Glaciihabitans sp.]|jgi:putative spermidine/putrescine transport system ATP-binding protein|nr:ABC transporter ATP-binding protein [Glaciihabitans sp.]